MVDRRRCGGGGGVCHEQIGNAVRTGCVKRGGRGEVRYSSVWMSQDERVVALVVEKNKEGCSRCTKRYIRTMLHAAAL
jgi:hypothetical protein